VPPTSSQAYGGRGVCLRRHRTTAVVHTMSVTAYHLMAWQTIYPELGADYFERRHAERVTRRAIRALERRGYRVTPESAA
jgi:hypothetical protein